MSSSSDIGTIREKIAKLSRQRSVFMESTEDSLIDVRRQIVARELHNFKQDFAKYIASAAAIKQINALTHIDKILFAMEFIEAHGREYADILNVELSGPLKKRITIDILRSIEVAASEDEIDSLHRICTTTNLLTVTKQPKQKYSTMQAIRKRLSRS